MNETERRKLNELGELISYIDYISDLAIVEGLHDKKALRYLGYKGAIIEVSKKTLDDLIKVIEDKYNKIVILTDFDEEGERMKNQLEEGIKDKEIKILTELRKEVKEALAELSVDSIEGIYGVKLRVF
jgi:5S rRNA maturation endonuclease (ribonuclease M5)